MGLYDDRLSDLSEARRTGRVAQRRASSFSVQKRNPLLRSYASAPRRPSMSAQSLLFDRAAGWTPSKSKAWAQTHGYRYGKVDVTDQYIRLRQSNPKGSTVKRTIPFGRGIRAVVAREETKRMATKKRRTKKKASSAKRPVKRHRRRARKVAVAAKRPKRRRAKAVVRKVRRRRHRAKTTTQVMEASRKRRRKPAKAAPKKRRRRRVRRVSAWKGNSAGHAKAAKKGHRRRKAKAAAAPKRRRRRHVRETPMSVASPRRKRRRSRRSSHVMESPRRKRRSHRMRASGGSGMSGGDFLIAIGTGGLGFFAADTIDRFIATYDPSATTALPTDKFTSSGAGTLANTLNIAAMPNWKRAVAAVLVPAIPGIGSMYIKSPALKSAAEGFAIGAGVSALKLLVTNVLMPMLIGKDTTTPALQKSYIARLYPAEVAAHINMKAQQTAVSSGGSGALSDAPAVGVDGPPDVGPFALAGDSQYPTAAQVLRSAAGVSGDSPYPTAAAVLRAAAGIADESPYLTATQALRERAGLQGVPYQPGPPPGPGPGPQASPNASCGCVGDEVFTSFLGDSQEETLTVD